MSKSIWGYLAVCTKCSYAPLSVINDMSVETFTVEELALAIVCTLMALFMVCYCGGTYKGISCMPEIAKNKNNCM